MYHSTTPTSLLVDFVATTELSHAGQIEKSEIEAFVDGTPKPAAQDPAEEQISRLRYLVRELVESSMTDLIIDHVD